MCGSPKCADMAAHGGEEVVSRWLVWLYIVGCTWKFCARYGGKWTFVGEKRLLGSDVAKYGVELLIAR